MVYDSPEYEIYPEVEVWDGNDSPLSDDGDWADLLADAEWDYTYWEGEWDYYSDIERDGFDW